jgi:hypothetical protein
MKQNILLLALFFILSLSDIIASQMMGSLPTTETASMESLPTAFDKEEEKNNESRSTQSLSIATDSILCSQEEISTPSKKREDGQSIDHPEIASESASVKFIAVD